MNFFDLCVNKVLEAPFIIQYLIALVLILLIKKFPKFIKFLWRCIMKFKTQNSKSSYVGQTFEETKPIYRLDKASNELVKTGDMVDIQEMVNSYLDSTMSKVLDRLLPNEDIVDSDYVAYSGMVDDLDIMQSLSSKAEDYKKKFNLDASLSIAEVFNVVREKSSLLKNKLDNVTLKEQVKEQEKEV